MEPILNLTEEENPDVPKLLSTMGLHNGTVLCLSWSNGTGRYLASGSDDNIILIWELDRSSDGYGSVPFGSFDGVGNVEHWKAARRLAGHESDVTDLSWSPDNRYLASCGLDSHVIIWDTATFERVKKIDQHHGFVKGVTWDPVGKYLATQSDDKTVKIWRTSDWSLEKSISDPFTQSAGTTFFRRLSWSPEGSHIAAANAINGSVPVAAVISRDTWKSDVSLVGHDAAVEVVKFNPIMFHHKDVNTTVSSAKREEFQDLTAVCAVGSQDRGISVWINRNARPLAVAQSVFQHSVLDLSWSSNGLVLCGCSYDGSVTVLQFKQEEFGVPLSSEEKDVLLAKYGYKKKAVIIAETPDQLSLEEENAVINKNQASKRIADLMGGDSSKPTSITNGSVETPKTPTFPRNSMATPRLKSNNEILRPSAGLTSGSGGAPSTPVQQKVTLTKDGRKRIQPQFLRGLSGPSDASPNLSRASPSLVSNPRSTHPEFGFARLNAPVGSEIEADSVASCLPQADIPTMVIGNKRKDHTEGGPHSKKSSLKPIDLNGLQLPSNVGTSIIKLATPKIKAHLIRTKVGEVSRTLECHNSLDMKEPSKILCTKKGTIAWIDYLPNPVGLLVGNSLFTAAACEDGCLHVYSSSGRRIFPCIMLDSPSSFLDCHGPYLMCITTSGLLSVWNIFEQRAIITSVSVAPLLLNPSNLCTSPERITHITTATVRPQGIPIITTSDGHGYTYHCGMEIWVRIADKWFLGSEFCGSGTIVTEENKGVLSTLQRASLKNADLDEGKEMINTLMSNNYDVQKAITMAHLETFLESSILLKSPQEYRYWLVCYARRLADETEVAKIEELCKDLLGPSESAKPSEKSLWQSTILGIPKHELLQDILPVLSSNRALFNITSEYKRMLANFEQTSVSE
ncbi:WD40 repeat-like protein [Basidiobolus meristosporus CBS 931.73]|uniref:Protein HIR n=1 Tax=Basidiobolus meristosporus CBS 931.73 TaxID=1314790 RepID=A0A1Y1Y228_9FUNG|nr:WD40 repeat-like protein [Basidiobolus meristosporus CBS 931.73]|eukprot:ORX92019.1 WD40 repeat-like protein [Basidiobolus meristosporus CBS 931.73]